MDGFHVTQVDHVEFFVPDRYAAARWYERTLGLRIVPEYEHWAVVPGGPLMISSDNGSTKLALFEGEPQGPRPTVGFHRVAFRVDAETFAAFVRRVADNPVYNERGDEVRELTVRDHGKAWSVYFCDPYGHRLEVTTYEVGESSGK